MTPFARILVPALLLSTALPPAAAQDRPSGVDLEGRNLSVKPGDDFDEYANGGWREGTEIPADRASTGVFLEVFNLAEQRNADLIQQAGASNPAAGSPQRMIADFYGAFMNAPAIEARGAAPLKPYLARIDAVKSKADLSSALGEMLRADVDPLNSTNFWTENLFGLFVTQALDDPTRSVPYLLQGGLGLPDRAYYLESDPHMAEIRTAYQAYIGDMLTLAGFSDGAARAKRVMDLEMKIAAAHTDRTASSDVHKANNPTTPAELASFAPGIDWNAYLSAGHLSGQPTIILWHKDTTAKLSALVGSEPLEAWKDWLAFHIVNQAAPFLSSAFVDRRFEFYGKTLQGTPAQRDRWKRGVGLVNGALGDAVGKIYVERYFPASSKAEVQTMVENIKTAFDRRISALDWMSPDTKEKAREKVRTMRVGVGYPEAWRTYQGIEIRPDDPLGNVLRAEEYETRFQLAKLGQPIDRGEWWMTPQTVNAVNLPLQNALNFPAAILEAPFFDPKADAAANYGAIGAVIGHEISHSFDDTGAGFDAEGRLVNWWTDADLAHFKQAGQRLVEQFNAYEPLPGLHVNGALTLGENIADVAGLAAAYDAYKMSLGGKPAPVIDGLTGDQRFFLAFGQAWREKNREAALRQQLVTDGHAPGSLRGQSVRNIDVWYDAFGVKPGEKLYLAPADRVRIW